MVYVPPRTAKKALTDALMGWDQKEATVIREHHSHEGVKLVCDNIQVVHVT